MRVHLKDSLPYWPLGLPKWRDDWLALELRNGKNRYIAVWRRGGKGRIDLPIGPNGLSHFEILFPYKSSTYLGWNSENDSLSIEIPRAPSARLIYAISP